MASRSLSFEGPYQLSLRIYSTATGWSFQSRREPSSNEITVGLSQGYVGVTQVQVKAVPNSVGIKVCQAIPMKPCWLNLSFMMEYWSSLCITDLMLWVECCLYCGMPVMILDWCLSCAVSIVVAVQLIPMHIQSQPYRANHCITTFYLAPVARHGQCWVQLLVWSEWTHLHDEMHLYCCNKLNWQNVRGTVLNTYPEVNFCCG